MQLTNKKILKNSLKKPLSQSGISLVEVLIAVLIMAVGMVGIAAMMTVTLKNSQSSLQHSAAVIQSYAMLDSLRANRDAAIIGQYNMNSWTCSPPSNDSRIGKELHDWINGIRSQVSNDACGRIVCGSLECNVSVRWNDERATGGAMKEYTLTTRI